MFFNIQRQSQVPSRSVIHKPVSDVQAPGRWLRWERKQLLAGFHQQLSLCEYRNFFLIQYKACHNAYCHLLAYHFLFKKSLLQFHTLKRLSENGPIFLSLAGKLHFKCSNLPTHYSAITGFEKMNREPCLFSVSVVSAQAALDFAMFVSRTWLLPCPFPKMLLLPFPRLAAHHFVHLSSFSSITYIILSPFNWRYLCILEYKISTTVYMVSLILEHNRLWHLIRGLIKLPRCIYPRSGCFINFGLSVEKVENKKFIKYM